MKHFTFWTLGFTIVAVLGSSRAEAQWETSAPEGAPQGGEPAQAELSGGAEEGPLLGAPAGGSVAGFLGYGVDLESGNVNPFGFTLGARGGYTFELPIYVGGTAAFMLGEKEGDSALRMFQIGAEVGYDFALGPVVLRPFLGLGVNIALTKSDFFGRNSQGNFYLAGGGTVLYNVNETLFVGGEIRGTSVFVEGNNFGAISFLATIGAHL